MSFFSIFLLCIMIQRLAELMIAKRNEKWMKEQGAMEFGKGHYMFMVMIHSLFFVSLLMEVSIFNKSLSAFWPFLLSAFILTQIGRFWVLASLGKHWNTKIIVLPGMEPVSRGPYKYIKHPNYLIVSIELMVIPLLFNAFFTGLLFLVLNQIILYIRISHEEKALEKAADYKAVFLNQGKFFPRFKR
jgi:methyltransferase